MTSQGNDKTYSGGNSLTILPASFCGSPPTKAAGALTSEVTAGVTATVEAVFCTRGVLGVTLATGTVVTGLVMATTGVAGVTAATVVAVAEGAVAGAG